MARLWRLPTIQKSSELTQNVEENSSVDLRLRINLANVNSFVSFGNISNVQ